MTWKELKQQLEQEWGLPPTMESILLLIGLNEAGIYPSQLSKEEKMQFIDLGMTHLLSLAGYFKRVSMPPFFPKYEPIKPLPQMTLAEQTLLLKELILQYFENIYNNEKSI